MSNTGKLFIISGPSGVGKGTLLSRLFKLYPNHFFSVSATTRKPRPGEVDGVHYHFISEEKFQDMIDNDQLLEYARYVSSSYGTPRQPVEEKLAAGIDVFLDVETEGCGNVKAKMPQAISVFVLPPDLEELERRLVGRGTETPEKIAARINKARQELELADSYDYRLVNDDVEAAAQRLLELVLNEKSKS